MKKWILLGLALIPLSGCAYYPDGYYGHRYDGGYGSYDNGPYTHGYYDHNRRDRDGYYSGRDYDR
ncbi:MAG: hypothetical protein ACREFW_08595 [Rhizomicrobium sp.]